MSVGRHWILTIPHHGYTPFLPAAVDWTKGQLEEGVGGYLHWQLVITTHTNCRLSAVKKIYGDLSHAELCRSQAAELYVWKDDTGVPNTRFELGTRPLRRNSKRDWDQVQSICADLMTLCQYNIQEDIYQ